MGNYEALRGASTLSSWNDQAGSDEGFDLNLGDGIDVNTFNQILEMDDSDDRDFSSSIVFDFFTQAEDTFKSMNDAL